MATKKKIEALEEVFQQWRTEKQSETEKAQQQLTQKVDHLELGLENLNEDSLQMRAMLDTVLRKVSTHGDNNGGRRDEDQYSGNGNAQPLFPATDRGDLRGRNMCEQLLTLRQVGTAKEFCRDFISLAAANQPPISEEILQSVFMVGLRPKIRAFVRLFEPQSLEKMMIRAQRVEEWFAATGDRLQPPGTAVNGPIRAPYGLRGDHTKAHASHVPDSPFPATSPSLGLKTLGTQNRSKTLGTQNHCEERYHVGQRCENTDLQVVGVKEDSTTEMEPPPAMADAKGISELEEPSLYSVVDMSFPNAMKFRGTISGETVTVMVVNGASHNFISDVLVKRIELPIDRTTGYEFIMATGMAVREEGICRAVKLSLPNLEVIADFFPLKLGNADVILGMAWLETVGRMEFNWRSLTMRLKRDGVWITLQGDPSLCTPSMSLNSFSRARIRDFAAVSSIQPRG